MLFIVSWRDVPGQRILLARASCKAVFETDRVSLPGDPNRGGRRWETRCRDLVLFVRTGTKEP